jgi:hypothetical protein
MPGDFREFFDVRKLDEQQRGSIEFVLNSPAYEDYFKPYISGILQTMNQQWKDRSQARKDMYPDEFLAGGVTFGEGMLKFFETIIHETSMERVHAAMENMTNDMLYEVKRQRGLVKPIIGLDQRAEPEPYNQDEDF